MTESDTLQPGRIALVTGASSGLGLATADGLLDSGLKVIFAARNQERLERLCAERGPNALAFSLDVTDGAAVAGLLDALPETWREIDVLVANAGSDVGGRQRFDEGAVADWSSTIETNVNGVVRVCHAVIPGMLARGRGHVVTIGSIAGLSTYAGGVIYSASKYAVRAFTEGLRKDYKQDPIRITEILPGLVRTGFAAARFGGDQDKAAEFYDSFPAALTPEDIAAATLFALEQPQHVNIAQIVVTPTGDK
ncbi:MAG: SDR family oxidoreductase [Pseudomonadota bacterium]